MKYKVNNKIIQDTIDTLKDKNLISSKAKYRADIEKREEVCYRDFDFLEILGHCDFEEQIIPF